MAEAHRNTCENCGAAATKHCAKCKITYYCSVTCQRAHWPKHKQEECGLMAIMRRCNRCNRPTGSWCDACEDLYTSTLGCGAEAKGRPLCNPCVGTYHDCRVCEVERPGLGSQMFAQHQAILEAMQDNEVIAEFPNLRPQGH